jgi:UPF0755 protein
MMLDQFMADVGPERMKVAASRRLTWYQVLSLASIVEQEAAVDAERPLIAGVYQNRIDWGMLLNADPTVIYGNDSLKLAALQISAWPTCSFWDLLGSPLADVTFPPALVGFQTYENRGLIPAPICTPRSSPSTHRSPRPRSPVILTSWPRTTAAGRMRSRRPPRSTRPT